MSEKIDLPVRIANDVDRIINNGDYSSLITFSGLLAGQYNLEYKFVSKLLCFMKQFSTAMDYDTATDIDLWRLIRSYKQYGHTPPLENRKKAQMIVNKSQLLHSKFPNNQYFNKYSFLPVSHKQADQFKLYIHTIILDYGLQYRQFRDFHNELVDFATHESHNLEPSDFKIEGLINIE